MPTAIDPLARFLEFAINDYGAVLASEIERGSNEQELLRHLENLCERSESARLQTEIIGRLNRSIARAHRENENAAGPLPLTYAPRRSGNRARRADREDPLCLCENCAYTRAASGGGKELLARAISAGGREGGPCRDDRFAKAGITGVREPAPATGDWIDYTAALTRGCANCAFEEGVRSGDQDLMAAAAANGCHPAGRCQGGDCENAGQLVYKEYISW